MPITREYGANGGTNPTTTTTVTIPAGCTTNDILILAVTNRGATADPSVVDTDAGGNLWAKIANQNADTNGAGTVWWKRATSATASKVITVSGTTNSMTCVLAGFRGCSLATTPYKAATGEANASANESHAAYTVDRAGSMLILSVHCTSNDTLDPTAYVATSPSTLTESGEHVSSGGLDCSTSLAYGIKSAAGSTGTISWSQTDGTGASIVFELYAPWVLVAASGAFALTGSAVTLRKASVLVAASGAFARTGSAVGLSAGRKIAAASGAFALTGQAVTLRKASVLMAASGAFSLTGTDVALLRGLKLHAASGTFTLAGQAVDLIYTPNTGYTLVAGSGSFVLSGSAVSLLLGRRLVAGSGAYALTGSAASLLRGLKIHAGSGTFTITGQAVTLRRVFPVPLERKLLVAAEVRASSPPAEVRTSAMRAEQRNFPVARESPGRPVVVEQRTSPVVHEKRTLVVAAEVRLES